MRAVPELQFPDRFPDYLRALATIGYRKLVKQAFHQTPAGPIIPPHVPEGEYDERTDERRVTERQAMEYSLACRTYDRDLIVAAADSLQAYNDGLTAAMLGVSVMWPKRMGRLVTWGGQQQLSKLLADRLEQMRLWAGLKIRQKKRGRKPKADESAAAIEPPIDTETADDAEATDSEPVSTWKTVPATLFEASLKGVSGIMPGHAQVNAIDLGFSPDGQKFRLNPWLEVLVLIGVESAPITVIPESQYPDGFFAVYFEGRYHTWFRRTRINPYYYAWQEGDTRPLTPDELAMRIDPATPPVHDLHIPDHLLHDPERLWQQIERLRRRAGVATEAEVAS